MPEYNKPAIAAAQAKWRKQESETWGKLDAESVHRRSDALLELFCAHVPINPTEGK